MKKQRIIWLVAAMFGIFVFQGCQKQDLDSNDETHNITIELSQEGTNARANDPIGDPIPVGFRCVYTVTEILSSTGNINGLSVGDKACLPCNEPCAELAHIRFFFEEDEVQVGKAFTSVDLDNENCIDCPLGGLH